jgi:hypothetical protein
MNTDINSYRSPYIGVSGLQWLPAILTISPNNIVSYIDRNNKNQPTENIEYSNRKCCGAKCLDRYQTCIQAQHTVEASK